MMKSSTTRQRRVKILLTLAALLAGAPLAQADENDPRKILKAMTDYVSSQASISAAVDTDIEVITPELQKIQFASSSKLLLSRPNKFRFSRLGGYADVDLVFDGKSVMLHGRHNKVVAQLDAPGTTDQLIDKLRAKLSIEAPGADLLLMNAYDALSSGVLDAKYIGEGVVGGVECDHLAFRNEETDWQIWVERGAKRIPRKYVITSKAVTGAPQYTLVIRDWKTDVAFEPSDFALSPPADAKKLPIGEITDMDEVPAGVIKGALQ